MEDTDEEFRNFAEEIYWTHFRSLHFFQLLSTDFQKQLRLPVKFVKNLNEKLLETVTIKGPSGAMWNVGLEKCGDTMFFRHGWKEFVEAHFLEENDFLIFKYTGNSLFEVIMFDKESFCEKEVSYFVGKCGHWNFDSGCQVKRKTRENSVQGLTASSEGDGCMVSEKHKKDDSEIPCPSVRRCFSLADGGVQKEGCIVRHVLARQKDDFQTPSPSSQHCFSQANGRTRKEASSTKQVHVKRKDADKMSNDKNSVYPVQYVSNRRPVTKAEKKIIYELALAAKTEEDFVVVMKPSHVYKSFYMSVPCEWVRTHLSDHNQNVVLHVKDEAWQVTFYKNALGGGGFIGGWKNFALENNLEESDVCLFKLSFQGQGNILFDVSIFRVVEEVALPSRVASSTLKRKKQRRKGEQEADNSLHR